MNIFRFFLGLFNPEMFWEDSINSQVDFYNLEKLYNPDKDPHYWLAQVYITRYKYNYGKAGQDDLKMIAFADTVVHACISEPDNARALGMYFIYKEKPDIITKYPKFGIEYSKLVSNAIKLQEDSPNQFLKLYQSLNPFTSK